MAKITSYSIVFLLISCDHLLATDALEGAKCPSEEWQSKGSFCYRLTSRGYRDPRVAAADCVQMNGNATLANITSQQMQQDVSDLLGNRSKLIEVWVKGCFKTEDTRNQCHILSNWNGPGETRAYYRCFTKYCTYPLYAYGVCQAVVDSVDQCSSSQCGTNSFNCADGYHDVTCVCNAGFTGKRCERNIDECASNPCQNEARCVDAANRYICECKAGYTGERCETDIDECHNNPCQHHGTCTDLINNYHCSCVEGTTGENCQTDIDECQITPCKHHGTCTDLINSYRCTCPEGTTGVNCETNFNECESYPCLNNGTCEDQINGFRCRCAPGYTNATCETDLDECESNPCQNSGQCEDLVNAFMCKCVGEYGGTHCQTDRWLAVKVAFPVVALLVLCAVIVGVIFIKRKGNLQNNNNPEPPHIYEAMDDITPVEQQKHVYASLDNDDVYVNRCMPSENRHFVNVDDLSRKVQVMTKNNLFEKEFENLPWDPFGTYKVSDSDVNIKKIRFLNMRTYDHSRVVLETLPDDPDSDYINASYIHGYNEENAYIATQGPKQINTADIWRMVWQRKSRRIVMLTHLVEDGKSKCHRYWPEEQPQESGGIIITPVCETVFAEYTVRIFNLVKEGENREVTHFQFTDWPEKGFPRDITALLNFRRKVKNMVSTTDEGPIVVHCCAGVGRTGSYIAIDNLLQQARAEGAVDVFECVVRMRKQRMKMVQTCEQYEFVYRSVLDALSSGETAIPTADFVSRYQEMTSDDILELKQQFQLLESLRYGSIKWDFDWALQDVNAKKNRDCSILPDKTTCPSLSTPVNKCNHYINAVVVNSFLKKDAFIVTQTPLPKTIPDIWRLLYELQSTTIVMLNESTTGCKYWPKEKEAVMHGPLKIEQNESVKNISPGVATREFKLSNTSKADDTRLVRQFFFTGWHGKLSVPPEKSVLRELIDDVNNWNRQNGNGPITVHDMNGCSRCGIFCTVSGVWEKMQADQEIDIFRIVRQLRAYRPQFIENVEQYQFCHEVALEYLAANEMYSNFQKPRWAFEIL